MSETAPKWTPEQEQAIVARGSDILVAAAAGSGKTATLVERVIRRLMDPIKPVDVDQLLVVTFTEAAATEMRERIGAAIQKALLENPEDARLQRQLAMLGRASISTLHSFCMSLIRQYFYRLGLDPAVQVMSEHEALLLRHEVLDDLFNQRFEEEPEGPFYGLVDRYGGGRDDEGLRQLVLTLYDYMQSLPWPEQWLADSLARFDLPEEAAIESLDWWPPLKRQVELTLSRAAQALAEADRLARRPGGPVEYAELLVAEREAVQAACFAESWAELAGAIGAVEFGRLPSIKKGEADEALQEQVKRLRDEAKKAVRSLADSYFARPAADWLADLRATAPHLQTLGEVVLQFGAAFREAKASQSAIDFNDLERFALQLLRAPESEPGGPVLPSDVARELRARYEEILVDEYQDINGVQDAILTLVARDGGDGAPNRFMVGDVKQSIYRFRHADPSLFLKKYQSFTPWAGAPADGGGRIVLGANFRSRAGVVDAVNFLFRQIMTAGAGELDYDEAAELRYRAGYPPLPDVLGAGGEDPAGPPVEVHLLDRQDGSGSTAAVAEPGEEESGAADEPDPAAMELAELSAVEREARLVAHRIREMVDGAPDTQPLLVWDKQAGGYRRIRYRDIVILLRATTGRVNTYLEVLSQAGIPAHGQMSTGYFAATEVEVVLSLLQILDNPRQDIPLAAVLRSPIVGLSTADLARIRVASPRGSFYEALMAATAPRELLAEAAVTAPAETAGEGGTVEQAEVLANFIESLERWRTLARRRPLSQVLWLIYQETGYLHYVAGMPGGAQRQANLLALYDRARQFDQFARQGLFRFLRFVERLREEEADMGAALALGEGEDVVRLMSIHKSKGLEFPVVFVASMGSQFARMDLTGDLLLEKGIGFGPLLVDPVQRMKFPTLAFHAVREATRLAALAEELRVLYVALTRARERLILVGSARDLTARCERWGAAAACEGWPLPETILLAADSYLDWVGPALMRHEAGEPLREAAGLKGTADPEVAADRSQWQVYRWDTIAQQALLDLAAASPEDEPLDWSRIGAAEPLDRPVDLQLGAALRERFDWRYKYADLIHKFGKLSVTELKGHFDPEKEDLPPEKIPRQRMGNLDRFPRFLQETRKALTPTERGTLAHLVLQHLDLTRPLNEADVTAQVADLVARQVLTAEQAEAVEAGPIARFFASDLGQRIRREPGRVQRELSFTLAIPAGEVYADLAPEIAAGESVIVQGMIDLLLEEEDGYVLVDYKTDRREPEEAAKRYGIQISLYRRAVEEILGRPVAEAYLHFLASDRSIRL
ncbi:MAG: UvrD-helicase domain-containing protein [Bacillota bacterium]